MKFHLSLHVISHHALLLHILYIHILYNMCDTIFLFSVHTIISCGTIT